ncbi:MAG: ABC transporter permease [archaeon]|jgi:putative ABC transport system permease protein
MNSEKYKSLINLTIKSIIRKKLRSTLTILSVIIGIASVVALITLSEGMLGAVSAQFEKMGSNSIFVMSANFKGDPNQAGRVSEETLLKMSDADNISKLGEVEEVYPMNYFSTKGEYKGEEQIVSVVTAPSDRIDTMLDFMDIHLGTGKTFNGKDGYYAMIGSYLATDGFKRKIKVGDTLKLNGIDFKVTGIMAPVGNQQDDSQIYIGRKSGLAIDDYGENVDYMVIKSKKGADGDLIVKKIEKILGKTRKEDTFAVITAASLLELIKRVLNIMRSILISIAAISLIVASLGIANSVYTSVLERTREIGVLKSIGAKVSDITFIFVFESVLLTLVGGVIGFGVGIGIAKLVVLYAAAHNFTMLTITITPYLVITTLVISLVVGIASGFFPARAATKMNIVDALRQ